MRAVHVTTLHRALDVRIFEKECRSLAAAGHEVHLVAHDVPAREREGVRLHGLPPADDGPRLRRIAARLRAAARAVSALDPELVHVHDPELLPLAFRWKARGLRVVYDVHEDTPREARTVLPVGSLRRAVYPAAWSALEAVARTVLDGFVCATPAIGARFPAARTVVARNFPRLAEFELLPAPDAASMASRPPRLVYVGGLTEPRGLREMMHAASLLPDALRCRLVLVGELSPPELALRWKEWRGFDRVEHCGWQERAGVLDALSQARVGLVLLHPTPEYRESWPVKLFEYMAAGLPVVASDFPLWREFVEGAGCGFLVDPLDPRAIARATEKLLAHPDEAAAMGLRGWRAARERYSWESEAKPLLALYERLAQGRR